MFVMAYSDAQKNFDGLFDKVQTDGEVIVKKSDGINFKITIEKQEEKSPFDEIKSFSNIPLPEILSIVHEARGVSRLGNGE